MNLGAWVVWCRISLHAVEIINIHDFHCMKSWVGNFSEKSEVYIMLGWADPPSWVGHCHDYWIRPLQLLNQVARLVLGGEEDLVQLVTHTVSIPANLIAVGDVPILKMDKVCERKWAHYLSYESCR